MWIAEQEEQRNNKRILEEARFEAEFMEDWKRSMLEPSWYNFENL